MTVTRIARVGEKLLADPNPKTRIARVGSKLLVEPNPKIRVARTSLKSILKIKPGYEFPELYTGVVASSLKAHYSGFVPGNMVDDNTATAFMQGTGSSVGDWVKVDLGALKPIGRVEILQGYNSTTDDNAYEAWVLQHSRDDINWTTFASQETKQPQVVVQEPDDLNARYIRLMATKSSTNWHCVQEFRVYSPTVDPYSENTDPNFKFIDSSEVSDVEIKGWWDGETIQPLKVAGWWDGSEIRDQIMLPPPIPNYDEYVMEDNPTIYLPMQETSGTPKDLMSRRDAVVNGAGSFVYNKAAVFPFTDRSMEIKSVTNALIIPDGDGLLSGTDFAVSANVELDTTNSFHTIAARDDNQPRQWAFYIFDGKLNLYAATSVLVGNIILKSGSQYNVAFRYVGGIASLYVNGFLDKSAAVNLPNASGDIRLTIGASAAGNDQTLLSFPLDGRMSHFAYYTGKHGIPLGRRFAGQYAIAIEQAPAPEPTLRTVTHDFKQGAIPSGWSRIGVTSGSEEWSASGLKTTTLAGQGYCIPAPEGDFTIETKVVAQSVTNSIMFGPWFLNDLNNGVSGSYYTNPVGFLILNVAAYNYSNGFIVGGSPSLTFPYRIRMRYNSELKIPYMSYSLDDGATWSAETAYTAQSKHPNRVGFGKILGGSSNHTISEVKVTGYI